ncbi:MAG: hypothetical protein AB1646_00230 [Thermodesulfobacteriota bacterium]
MSYNDEFPVSPELSIEFQTFEEFCAENPGQETTYLDMVANNPLEMDSVTLAFSMRHMLKFSKELAERLLQSLGDEFPPNLRTILDSKGIQLDKKRAAMLRDIVFAFRDAGDDEVAPRFVRALQMLTMTRERRRIILNLGESYSPPDEGWNAEDFGGDESLLAEVRSIENPYWIESEEK